MLLCTNMQVELNNLSSRLVQYFRMPKSSSSHTPRRNSYTKNVYFQKINSLMKIMGDSHASLPCLNKVRKTISSESHEGWLLQRKENNKDAARKARLRKKIYMQLLEQSIQNLQTLNKESKQLEATSDELLESLRRDIKVEPKDQIDQYLMAAEEGARKNLSQSTMDSTKENDIYKIISEIYKIVFPSEWSKERLRQLPDSPETLGALTKMRTIIQQLPEQWDYYLVYLFKCTTSAPATAPCT